VFHGTKDTLFPIDQTSRKIVPQVAKMLPNSQINYAEHQGAHEVPPAAMQQGLEWFLQDKPISPTKFQSKGKAAPRKTTESGPRSMAG
jgi:hypothetical protein